MRSAGFTLVELLVAAAIIGVVLVAAFGWLWNVAAVAAKADDRAQAATIAAACTRAVACDVGAALAVVPPPSGRQPARTLALLHDRPEVAGDDVLVVWDPSRRVVWRNASGTYIADHVAAFAVAYVLADGSLVAGEHMGVVQWPDVHGVRIDLTVAVGSATVARTLLVSVRPS